MRGRLENERSGFCTLWCNARSSVYLIIDSLGEDTSGDAEIFPLSERRGAGGEAA